MDSKVRGDSSGFKRWWTTAQGQRVGLVARHPASHVDELAPTLELDEALILRRFKHDAAAFGQAKEAFLAGLNQFPTSL